MGNRFDNVVALDTETKLIAYPDQVNPDMVCCSLAYSNGMPSVVIKADSPMLAGVLQRLFADPKIQVVGHNLAFDLHVIIKRFPELEPIVFAGLSLGKFGDTRVREKLTLLQSQGHCDVPCSLSALSEKYCGTALAGKTGDAWRFRYEELIDVPITDWPQEALEYALQDAETTLAVWQCLKPQASEDLQVQAEFALRALTIAGIRTDQTAVAALNDDLTQQWNTTIETLRGLGMIRDKGSRDMAAIRAYLVERGVTELTDKRQISTSRATVEEALSRLPDDIGLQALAAYSAVQKGLNTFVPQMSEARIHPNFNSMMSTLRTSCSSSNYHQYKGKEYGTRVIKRGDPYPSINLQQIPADERYRKVFVPEEGHVFVCADYSNLELVCAAQTYYNIFKFSDMMEVLNKGVNLHDDMAAFNLGITLDEFYAAIAEGNDEYAGVREQGKTITLGIPGGRGWRAIARERGISDAEAEDLYNRLRGRFSELPAFFGAFPGDPGWLGSRKAGHIVIDGDVIATYEATGPLGVRITNRTYCQFANCLCMQMPGALGAKFALFALVRATRTPSSVLYGCSVKALIHDEFLVSVPVERAEACRQEICDLMCSRMQIITPNMRVECKASIQEHWTKGPTGPWDKIEYHLDPALLVSSSRK